DEVDADQVITRVLQTVGLPQVGAQPVAPAAYSGSPAQAGPPPGQGTVNQQAPQQHPGQTNGAAVNQAPPRYAGQ
ncbi:MoxR family ATPase, partial [Streptomyces sp. SID10244]|nr:MoxR family ATPase [Streptomyces sp. SID10244]